MDDLRYDTLLIVTSALPGVLIIVDLLSLYMLSKSRCYSVLHPRITVALLCIGSGLSCQKKRKLGGILQNSFRKACINYMRVKAN